jgi:hypothetical protein
MVQMRVRPRELKLWRAAAKLADETLSEWARAHLNLLAMTSAQRMLGDAGDQVELPLSKSRRKAS